MRSPRGELGPLSRLWPELASDLITGLTAEGEPDLAAQVTGLKVVSWHACGDDFCHSFDTAQRDGMPGSADGYSIPIEDAKVAWNVVVEVESGSIVHVEVVTLRD